MMRVEDLVHACIQTGSANRSAKWPSESAGQSTKRGACPNEPPQLLVRRLDEQVNAQVEEIDLLQDVHSAEEQHVHVHDSQAAVVKERDNHT